MRALAEAIESGCRFRVREGGSIVQLGQRRVGRLEVGAENAAAVTPAQVERPGGVRLVLQDVTADEPERLLERGAREAGRLTRRALEQLVESVEVE